MPLFRSVKQGGATKSMCLDAKMFVSERRRETAARRPIEKSDLDQVRLDDLFDRILLLVNRSRDRAEPNRAAVELLDDRQQQFSIHLIETIQIGRAHV